MSIDYNLLTYNALDSACTTEVWEQVKKDIDPHGYRWAYDFTLSLYQPLMYMQTRGIKVDFAGLEETKLDIIAKQEQLQAELNKLCGRELNANSPKQCIQYFYIEKGIAPYYKGKSITTDDKAMQRIARGTAKHKGMREARLVQDIRGLVKLYGTYLDIDFDSDGRLRCAYNPRGTKFGRLSSSETVFGTGTNAQNLPPEFKKFLVADPGYFFWEVDKRHAEWVVVAYLTGDANMLQVVLEGADPHVHTAHLMFRVDKSVIELDHKLCGHMTDPDEIAVIRAKAGIVGNLPRVMSGRQMGKKSNHGLDYDEGFNTFALVNEIEIPESKRIINLYHQIYPGIRRWYEAIKQQLSKDRSLTNCLGRRIRFLDSWGDDLFKAAYASIPQSTVADCINTGLRSIYEDGDLVDKEGANIDLLAQIHDSILMQCPVPILSGGALSLDTVVRRVYNHCEPMLEYNGRQFKIATDSKFGLNWGDYHPENNPQGMREFSVDDPNFIQQVKDHLLWQSAS